MAGGGHSFPGDPVHLVEGVRPQVTVVCSANEHLQVDGLLAVANELRQRKRGDGGVRGGGGILTAATVHGPDLRCEQRKQCLNPGLHFYFSEC